MSESRLESLLRNGEFVVCGEMAPPTGASKEPIQRKSDYFKGFVDAVNLTDNATGIVRLSSIMSSVFLSECGLEPIMQMTCRDRNRIGLQSDALGANAAGIKNLLCLTGDYQTFGNHPGAKGVFDLDSVQLIKTMDDLNKGLFLSGDEVKPPTQLFIGGGENPFAEPMDLRIMRLGKKIWAGAKFIQTQPVFDLPRFKKWFSLVRKEGYHELAYIIAGVMPVRSAKALLYMQESVPGMSISKEYIERMQSTEDPKEEGVKICVEIIEELKNIDGICGVHIMPVMWESITSRIVNDAGLLPRPSIPLNLEVK